MLGGFFAWPHPQTSTTLHLVLAVLLLVGPVSSIWPFSPKRFSKNSLLESGSMGLGDGDRIIAFGDFNGDQFVDVLALDSTQTVLSVYIWNHDAFVFKKSSELRHTTPISNVVPGDFTHDGALDILVMSGHSGSVLDMDLYRGNHDGTFASTPISAPFSALPQPIPVDFNGDMKIDMLGTVPGQDASGLLKAWKNMWNTSASEPTLFELDDPPFTGTQCKLASPHSNAIIDLNGDCLADIFLVCDEGSGKRSFQIWVNNKGAGFSLAQSQMLPSGVQAITFADMDRDGTIDMVFPTCSSVSSWSGVGVGCSINIAYNKQIPVCPSAGSQTTDKEGNPLCRPHEALCIADHNFSFDLDKDESNEVFVQIPFSSLSKSEGAMLVLDTSFKPALPLPVRLGDTNSDGFPDMAAIAMTANGATPKLFISEPCTKGLAGCDANGHGRRGFRLLQRGAESLEAIHDARGVAFMDMDEDGTLDLVIQRRGSQGQGTITFVQNNVYYDAFFLKAIVLNGACNNAYCTSSNGSNYLPFGVSYSGASYKYTVLDTSGQRSAAQVGQLPQTSYHSLLTPYSFFGLGRTNNYIENLFVGSTKHTQDHFIDMEGVIPNSRVVIHPPPGLSDGSWKRELFLRPGQWIPWVTLTVVVATAILAVIVFILHLNEKREDESERRRASHHINFDAL